MAGCARIVCMPDTNDISFDETTYLALRDAIEQILNEHADGLSEFDMLNLLQQGDTSFSTLFSARTNNHDLFRVHFLLFHCLYRLRSEWAMQHTAWLDISALKIRRLPYTEGELAVTEHDPLHVYYLDLTHLTETSEEDVDNLIAAFWTRYVSHDRRNEALALLGLTDPVDDDTIKNKYRRLVMQHHPDRGGDKVLLQKINEAAGILLMSK